MSLRVVCSKGTYVRTLCADIGVALGVGAHLFALERRRVGPLSIDRALTVGQIADRLAVGTLHEHMITIDEALSGLPLVAVTDAEAERVMHGGAVAPIGMAVLRSSGEPASVRLQDRSGRLLAIGTYDPQNDGPIKVHKVLADIESLN